MKLEQWVLFIDMLGYREINGKITNEASAKDFIEFMKFNRSIFADQDKESVQQAYKSEKFDLYHFYDIQVKFISDSLIINYFPKEVTDKLTEDQRILHSANTLFIIINRLQTYLFHCLNKKQILVRGGISNKFCVVEDNFAVGEGLIEAYQLESKTAVYPRIVLSESIASNSKLIASFEMLTHAIYGKKTFLHRDENGIHYINYLFYNLTVALQVSSPASMQTLYLFIKAHKSVIDKEIKSVNERKKELKKSDPKYSERLEALNKIEAKILWLKAYHNKELGFLGDAQFLIE